MMLEFQEYLAQDFDVSFEQVFNWFTQLLQEKVIHINSNIETTLAKSQ